MALERRLALAIACSLAALSACAPRMGPSAPLAAPSPPVTRETSLRSSDVMDATPRSGPAPSLYENAGVRPDGLRLTGLGTGFYVTPHRVLTNSHVVAGCKALGVGNNHEGVETSATVLAQDVFIDLALLWTEAEGPQSARFQNAAMVSDPAHLAIVGYPEHGRPVLEAELDEVSLRSPTQLTDRGFFSFAGSVRRGNSGGPVLDASGAVVGVVTAKVDTVAIYQRTGEVVADVGFAIGNATTMDFLGAAGVKIEAAMPSATLSSPELLRTAHDFVRQIRCWK